MRENQRKILELIDTLRSKTTSASARKSIAYDMTTLQLCSTLIGSEVHWVSASYSESHILRKGIIQSVNMEDREVIIRDKQADHKFRIFDIHLYHPVVFSEIIFNG